MNKLELVKDWKQCWKWVSMWCLILTGAVSETWKDWPPEWQKVLLNDSSVGLAFHIISILSFIGIIGRLLKKGKSDV